MPAFARIAFIVLAFALTVRPAVAKRAVCPDGRFVQAERILPAAGSAGGAFDALVVESGKISIESGCGPAKVHQKGLKSGATRVRAKWGTCGTLRKVHLAGTIIEDGEPCRRFLGTVKAKKTDAIPFTATRSACGDGIVDAGAGETCDPPGVACSDQCTDPAGTPIVAPARTWTWVPFADAFCANGSTTGIGINPGDAGGRLFIFLNGGGACWDESTCYDLGTASYIQTGYGATQFASDATAFLNAGFFDRSDASNPFRNDSFVFVPYCTGDVHAGTKPDANYGGKITRHVGYLNVKAYLNRLVPTFSGASRVILSGSSAGGVGALSNWYQTQQAFGALRVDMIDDSGPTLPAPYLTEQLEQTWRNAWNLTAITPPGCTQCASDLDAVFPYYGMNFTGHRGALLSYTNDPVVGVFYNLDGASVEAALGALATEMAPFDVWRHFYVTGAVHTMLGTPSVQQNGVSVKDFLTKMVTDDPSWVSVEPGP
jgi:hypothetical protein